MSEELEGLFETLENDLLSRYQYNLLLNYITNLQKELEKKDVYIKYLEEYNPKYYKGKIFYGDGREDYKQRNEKAIEFIKEWWYEKNTRDINRIVSLGDKRIDLLNILKGDDE